MKRILLVFFLGSLCLLTWAQNQRGLLLVVDSTRPEQVILHRELVERLKQERARGYFSGTGLENYFQIYDFAQPQMSASLHQLGISNARVYLCLTQLDSKERPVKILWRDAYTSAQQAVTALGEKLSLPSPNKSPDVVVTPLPSASATSEVPRDRVDSGAQLLSSSMLESPSRQYRFVLQTDGNCVLYRLQGDQLIVVWATETFGRDVCATLDNRGRLQVRSGARLLWSSPEQREGFYQLQLQDDGNLVIYRRVGDQGVAVWASRQ